MEELKKQYRIILYKDGVKRYITQTQKRYFNIAINYALKNNIKNVKVNRIKYYFDFKKMIVLIQSRGEQKEKYKIERS